MKWKKPGFFILVALLVWPALGRAGLSESDLANRISPPFSLGVPDPSLPIWNLLDGGGAHAGYIFESNDLASLPGFSGTPINLLVSIDREGNFIDVRVLSQNEPVFVSGLGAKPLHDFVRQYPGKSLASNIMVRSKYGSDGPDVGTGVVLDGVTKATASVRIVNETILASALKVAREKLSGVAPRPAGRPRQDIFEVMSWDALIDAGLVQHRRLTNKETEAAFAGSPFAGEDDEGLADPEGIYADVWVADLGLPIIARNLLTEAGIDELYTHVKPHEEPILILTNGRHQIVGPEFVRNTVPRSLEIIQDSYPVSLRDADVDILLKPGLPAFEQAMAFRLDSRLGFDPSSPWRINIKVVRSRGQFHPEFGSHDMSVTYALADKYFILPSEKNHAPSWIASWNDQKWNLIILGLFLTIVSVALWRQQHLTRSGWLRFFRYASLAFTLGFIGWFAQGQLSIVNLLALGRAITEGQDLVFFLYDPITLSLWIFVFLSLIVWGRGFFCGWLCPFGVLQEIGHVLGRALKIPFIKLPQSLDRVLVKAKYPVLGILVISAVMSPTLADKLVEIEPFKTSITLYFDRALPYVFYALAWIFLGLAMFKPFCRFVCPLGAALALLGKVRMFSTIPRRAECGAPCRLCEVRCQYKSIERQGHIDFDECYQCLECVDIYNDRRKCVPLVLAAKGETH